MKNDKIKLLLICSGVSAMFGLSSCGCSNESEVYYGEGPGEATNQENVSGSDSIIVDDSLFATDSLAPDAESVIPDSAKSLDENKATKAFSMNTFVTSEEAIEYMKNSGHWDEYSQGILPQMTGESLPYAQKLLNSQYEHFIIVDKDRMKVVLCDKYGRVKKEYTMACAKNYGSKSGDWDSRTPEGFFSAEGVYNSTDWLFKDKNGHVSPTKGQYGPRFIRLKTPITSGVGIHGTCSPGALGKRVSHGCIRIKNENILELVQYVEKGMPIIVSPGARDMKVNDSEGRVVAKISSKKIVVDANTGSNNGVAVDSVANTVEKEQVVVDAVEAKVGMVDTLKAEKSVQPEECDTLKK